MWAGWPLDLGRAVHGESWMWEMIAQSHTSSHEQQLARWDAARKFQSVYHAVVDVSAGCHIQRPEESARCYPQLWLAPRANHHTRQRQYWCSVIKLHHQYITRQQATRLPHLQCPRCHRQSECTQDISRLQPHMCGTVLHCRCCRCFVFRYHALVGCDADGAPCGTLLDRHTAPPMGMLLALRTTPRKTRCTALSATLRVTSSGACCAT